MTVVINGDTGISPVTASGTDASINGLTVGKGGGAVATNTAVGASALSTNSTGSASVAIGYQALATTSAGVGLTGVGYQALNANTGDYNTAIGWSALLTNSTGVRNTAVGVEPLKVNTTGSYNTAIGMDALVSNTTASYNTATGYQAGYSNLLGSANTFLGYQAGYSFVAGSAASTYNTFLGYSAGYSVTTGTKNTIIGTYSGNQGGLDIRTASNYIVLSDGDGNPAFHASVTTSGLAWTADAITGTRYSGFQMSIAGTYKSQIYWDNTNTNLYVQNASQGVYLSNNGASWTANSDERLKENLVPIENGLAKVCTLRSVIGNYISDESKKPTPFLIAQDVQAVLPEAVTQSQSKDQDQAYLGVSYTEVIPLLVASIKELKTIVDAQAALISGQATEIAELKAKVG